MSFPSLIAIWRKMQAAGMVVAELSTSGIERAKENHNQKCYFKNFFWQ
ncbi:MAG: hypothetical protein IPG09_18610 [Ignavibacteria bacterium]|nr:hypothetical protein [Ignavibacteria bacterium]